MIKLTTPLIEKLKYAYGIDVPNPRISWKYECDESNIAQKSYRIIVRDENGELFWDSSETESGEFLAIYGGVGLLPARKYTVSLSTVLSDGRKLREENEFLTGMQGSGLFEKSFFIAMNDKETEEVNRQLLPAFRKEFEIKENTKSVRLFTSGCGIYVATVNGERVNNIDKDGNKHINELTPGFTETLERKLYHSYDITHMVNEGMNCISAIVAQGWWSDEIVTWRGTLPAFRALMVITYNNGEKEYIFTDESWKVSNDHPIRHATVYRGEKYDARYSMDFRNVGFDDSSWKNAAIFTGYHGVVSAHRGEYITCREDLKRTAQKVYTYKGVKDAKEGEYGTIDGVINYPSDDFYLKAGETAIVDLGQNFAGREAFRVIGKSGCMITIKHGEMLNDGNGKRSRGCDGPEGSAYIENLRTAPCITFYIVGKDDTEEEYRPLFTFYGFRYAMITATDDVHFTGFWGEVITSVGYDSGKIECGNEFVNKLISNGRWGMYSNYLSVPTDCPQRDERLGWTADTQVFTNSAQYFSTASQTLLEKWLQDCRDVQHEDGPYMCVAPLDDFKDRDGGQVGWSDGGILVPYKVWKMSGDITVVRQHYHSMKLCMDNYLAPRGNKGHRPQFGDWLAFEDNSFDFQEYLGVAYYAWDGLVMSEMAQALGLDEDAKKYRKVYDDQKEYFIKTYINEDGTVKYPQQCAALYAIKLGLYPDEKSYRAIVKQLTDNFERTGDRLQTGFLGTAILMQTLSENGLNDLAYRILLQDKMPSWLYSVKAGATTIWERWNSYSVEDGFGNVDMNSFNHYAYGCVAEWLFGYMAGIRTADGGFSHFLLAPIVNRDMGYAKAEYDSVNGIIRSEWKYEGDKLIYSCTVPLGSVAEFVNPITGEKRELATGDYRFEL